MDDRGFKRKRLTASENTDEQPMTPSMRSGNQSSPRAGPPDYRDSRCDFRFASDKAGGLRENRSRSPDRKRGGRHPSGQRDKRYRDAGRQPPAPWNSYRTTNDSAPASSPAQPGPITDGKAPSVPRAYISSSPHHNQPNNDPAMANKVSSPLSNHPNEKNDLVNAPEISSPKPKPANRTDSNAFPNSTTQTSEVQSKLVPEMDTAKEFGNLLYMLLEEATDLAALKVQKMAKERDVDRREKDFNKTKGNHEKFPATEEFLRKSTESAKKALFAATEKCQSKDAALKDIVFQSAARLLPQLGPARQDQIRVDFDSLEKRCQELETEVQEQKLFVESQRLTRETLDREYKDLQQNQKWFIENQRLTSEALDEEYKNLFHQKMSAYDKKIEDIKLQSLKTTETFSALSKRIPQVEDLQSKLDSLSGRIGQLETLHTGKTAKEETMSITTSKPLAESTKSLEGYSQKLESLDIYVRGSDTKPGLSGHILSIEKAQSNFLQELDKAHPNWTSVVERVAVLENQTLGLDQVEKRLGVVEKKTSPESSATEEKLLAELERLTNLEKRLKSVESSAEKERLSSLEKRISTVENARRAMSSTTVASMTPPAVDIEALKKECIAVFEDMQASTDILMGGDIDTLKTTVKDIQGEMDTRQTELYMSLSELPAKLDALSQKVGENEAIYVDYFTQIEKKFKDWGAGQAVIQQGFDNRLMTLQQGVENRVQGFDNRVDAVEMNTLHLDNRMNNLNTRDMGIFILDQLDATYPNLRIAENTLVEHKDALQRTEGRFVEMLKFINKLQIQIKALETQIKQTSETQDVDDIRKDVFDLAELATASKALAKEAKDEIAKISAETSKIIDKNAADIVEKLVEFQEKLDKLKDGQEALATKISLTTKIPTMSPAVDPDRAGLGNGPVMNIRGISGRAKQGSQGSDGAPRMPSGELLIKKHFTNGQAPSGRRNKTNGFRSNSPRKRKKGYVDGDDSDDPSFEPKQPEIFASDDEDD